MKTDASNAILPNALDGLGIGPTSTPTYELNLSLLNVLQYTDSSKWAGGAPWTAVVSGHNGANAFLGYTRADGVSSMNLPSGVTGQGDLITSGNEVFGVYGHAFCYANGSCLGSEFTSWSMTQAGDAQLPPRNGSTLQSVANGVNVTCGDSEPPNPTSYTCSIGVSIGSNGGVSASQQFATGIWVSNYTVSGIVVGAPPSHAGAGVAGEFYQANGFKGGLGAVRIESGAANFGPELALIASLGGGKDILLGSTTATDINGGNKFQIYDQTDGATLLLINAPGGDATFSGPISSTASVSGISSAPNKYINQFSVNADSINAGGNVVWGLANTYVCCSSTTQGQRNGVGSKMVISSPSNASDTRPAYVPVAAEITATTAAPNLTSVMVGMNSNVSLTATATGWGVIAGVESDVTVLAGSNPVTKAGVSIILGPGDAVQGSTQDAALLIGEASGSTAGWKNLIYLNQLNGKAIDSAGSVFNTVGSVTLGTVLDLSSDNLVVSDSIIKTATAIHMNLSGAGKLTLPRNISLQFYDGSGRRNFARWINSSDQIVFGDTDNGGISPASWNFLSGNVGIGTAATPGSPLTISAAAASTVGYSRFVTSDYVSGTTGSGLLFYASGNSGNVTSSIMAGTAGFSAAGTLSLNGGISLSNSGAIFSVPVTVPGTANPVLATATSVTSGAGASMGTLTNAPAAGNPSKWVPFNDNGTTRYFPVWGP